MSVGKPVLFYSKTCPNSKRLWSLLQSENRLHEFIKVPIEDNPRQIPPYIREVPTIYINPQSIFTGMQIHNYLSSLPPPVSNISFGNMSSPSIPEIRSTDYTPMQSNQPRPSGNIDFKKMKPNISSTFDPRPRVETATNGTNGIDDFIPSEMSGAWSDSYSFVSDNPAPMLMNFDYINDNHSQGAPAAAAKSKQMMSETERRYHEMQQSRAMPFNRR
jgi:hypothetical protein